MKHYLSLVKFSHTVFALPFALLGFFLGTLHIGQGLSFRLLALVVLCMVFARSAAMAFNRYLDRDIDGQNQRTVQREIPAGIISPRAALLFVIANSLLFWATTWFINPLCFALAPVALAVVLGYSYTKRFTFLCHFVLGLGLSLAPIGAYLAVTGSFQFLPLLYSAMVLCWVSGFDIIYALQDEDFDRSRSLNSVPVRLGRVRALRLAALLHLLCAALAISAGMWLASSGAPFFWLHWAGVAAFASLLYYQHSLVSPNDLSRVDMAFFTTNGVASIVFCSLVVLDVYF